MLRKESVWMRDPQKMTEVMLKWVLPITGIIFVIMFWVIGLIHHYFFSLKSECLNLY